MGENSIWTGPSYQLEALCRSTRIDLVWTTSCSGGINRSLPQAPVSMRITTLLERQSQI